MSRESVSYRVHQGLQIHLVHGKRHIKALARESDELTRKHLLDKFNFLTGALKGSQLALSDVGAQARHCHEYLKHCTHHPDVLKHWGNKHN
jgi:hypothetical protein